MKSQFDTRKRRLHDLHPAQGRRSDKYADFQPADLQRGIIYRRQARYQVRQRSDSAEQKRAGKPLQADDPEKLSRNESRYEIRIIPEFAGSPPTPAGVSLRRVTGPDYRVASVAALIARWQHTAARNTQKLPAGRLGMLTP